MDTLVDYKSILETTIDILQREAADGRASATSTNTIDLQMIEIKERKSGGENVQDLENAGKAPLIRSDGASAPASRMSMLAGIIREEEVHKFNRHLFRVSKG